jgi:hypothetical protein
MIKFLKNQTLYIAILSILTLGYLNILLGLLAIGFWGFYILENEVK